MNAKSYTKADLINIINAQNEELGALRRVVSEQNTYVKTLAAEPVATPPSGHVDVEYKDEERVAHYHDFAEATERCKALVAWDADRRFIFTQRGNKVICKPRVTH